MDFNLIPDSRCDQCDVKVTCGILREPVAGEDGVFELAILCQNCGRRVHSCYTSAALEQLADKKDQERDVRKRLKFVRQHQRAFAELQKKMAASHDAAG